MDFGLICIDILTGLSRGLLYFLIASGLAVTLGTLGIINFAHGAFYMCGAYIAWTVAQVIGNVIGAFWIGAAVGTAFMFLIGLLIEFVLLRRIYATEHLYQMLLTFALVLVIDGLALEIWGGLPKSIFLPEYLRGHLSVMGHPWPVYSLFTLLFSTALAIGLWFLLYRTRFGKECRAAAMDREVSEALGINVPRVFMLMFATGAAIAALAGGVGTAFYSVSPGLGVGIIVICFAIIVIGGMGSLMGAFIGALILGMIESFGWHYFPWLAMHIPYILMAVILLTRPQGLFGRR
ncbi:MAG: branched-chain amino acid ABC transporter permease [Proteobacteria bacterium]|nr:branched-chain amino acid ABC transporter permease [Pseudomonadota bacterium]